MEEHKENKEEIKINHDNTPDKPNKSGKGSIIAIVIIIVLSIAAIVGTWYYMDSKAKSQKKSQDAQIQELQKQINELKKEEQKAQEGNTNGSSTGNYKLTTRLTSHNRKFTFSLPDGWTVTNDTELDYVHAIGYENMTYKPGTPAVIKNELGFRGGGLKATSIFVQYGSTMDLKDYYNGYTNEGAFTTASNLTGTKYTRVFKDGTNSNGEETRVYGYTFFNGDKTILFTYTKLPIDSDQKELVEAMIKTFSFIN